jgi:predicted nucleic acid-binding Zn ribbon protein
MMEIGLRWLRAETYEAANVQGVRVIRPAGKRRYWGEPFKIEGDYPLYVRFANLDRSEESCLKFASLYGLLRSQSRDEAEPLEDWYKEIRNMKALVPLLQLQANENAPGGITMLGSPHKAPITLTSINAVLVPGSRGKRPKLSLEPATLREAMYLQLGLRLTTVGSLQSCKLCGKWFERGTTKARRSIAVFCSEKCKNHFSYVRRRERLSPLA